MHTIMKANVALPYGRASDTDYERFPPSGTGTHFPF
jgi:hypothetical protein